MKRFTINNIPLIIGLTLSMLLLYEGYGGGNFMGEDAGFWSMTVALVGILGSLIVHLISFRKDSTLLKKDSGTLGSVKEDTTKLVPQTENINENTKKIRDLVMGNMVPNLNHLMGTKKDVSKLVDELNYQKRLKQETSATTGNMDVMLNGIRNVYEVNAKLATDLRVEQQKNQELLMENFALKDKVEQYEAKYKSKNRDLDR